MEEWANRNCEQCKNTGYIIIKRYYEGQVAFLDYAYQCACSHGKEKDSAEFKFSDVRSETNLFARYIPIRKEPLVLIDTQIWKGGFPTGEKLKRDELINIFKRDSGFGINADRENAENAKIKDIFG